MLQNHRILIACLILAVTLGCKLFSGKTKEVVLAPTEIGTPVGDKVTKEIGSAGGTLTSTDGRLTLSVPQNALPETVQFSIQPITNTVQTGIGLAYRLGPDGKTFNNTLELSVRYDERDLEGTAAEALAIAFQDKERKWHVFNPIRLDDAKKSVTFSITHFTDFSFLARMRLEPSRATLRVGETMQIKLIGCGEPGIFQPRACVMGHQAVMMEWYTDIGTVTTHLNPAIYTAPPRKPNPNVATVSVPYALPYYRDDRVGPILPGEVIPERRGMFTAHITIVDRGYRAAGTAGGMSFSGVVCRLDKPFTIYGHSQLTFNFRFTPSSETGEGGTVGVGGGGHGVTLHSGSGTYTVNGIDTDSPRIALSMATFTGTHPKGSAEGSGTRYIDLIPLDTNECDGQ